MPQTLNDIIPSGTYGSDSPMAGFEPWLIPDRFHLANQATLARGVRLSLAPSTTPPLTTALEPGVDTHCVCRLLGGIAADGKAGGAGRFVTHPLAVATDRPNGGGHFAGPRAFSL